MGDRSQIQWTDATWNPITGCSKVSPGCAHCYAEQVAARFWKTQYPLVPCALDDHRAQETPIRIETLRRLGQPGCRWREFTDVQCHEDRLDQPLSWKRPRKVFVNSMSDLFHEAVPDEFVDRMFAVMALAPQHTFQVLTKRAERMRQYFAAEWHRRVARLLMDQPHRISRDQEMQRLQGWSFGSLTCGDHDRRFLPNVWLGVSVENQHFADERIPLLLQTPAAVRFISAEPLLGAISIERWLESEATDGWERQAGENARSTAGFAKPSGVASVGPPSLDWIIVGGESGRDARPCDRRWLYSILDQCKAAATACFIKQLGANSIIDGITRTAVSGRDWRLELRDSHGGDPAEWPSGLCVRDFPKAASA